MLALNLSVSMNINVHLEENETSVWRKELCYLVYYGRDPKRPCNDVYRKCYDNWLFQNSDWLSEWCQHSSLGQLK